MKIKRWIVYITINKLLFPLFSSKADLARINFHCLQLLQVIIFSALFLFYVYKWTNSFRHERFASTTRYVLSCSNRNMLWFSKPTRIRDHTKLPNVVKLIVKIRWIMCQILENLVAVALRKLSCVSMLIS